jgi:hypothetical protein
VIWGFVVRARRLVAGLEFLDERHFHAAHETDLVCLRYRAGERARQKGAFFFP